MAEVDRARRARERGDGRTWRERALDAEAALERLASEESFLEPNTVYLDGLAETEVLTRIEFARDALAGPRHPPISYPFCVSCGKTHPAGLEFCPTPAAR